MKLSIVTTLYMSAPYIDEFCGRAGAVSKKLFGDDYEIILVNDGSPDNALEVAIAAMERDRHITVVDLSRNFGHHKAMMTGIEHSTGELVYMLDVDLEEEPEWLSVFHDVMLSEKCDSVYGVQQRRKGKIFERVSGWLYYKLFNLLTGVRMPKDITNARIMTRRFADALLMHQDREPLLAGLFYLTGFKQVSHAVTKHSKDSSAYTLRKKMAVVLNSVTSFSAYPLIIIFFTGLVITAGAIVYIIWLIYRNVASPTSVSGWSSTIGAVVLFGGLNTSFIGVIGLYLSKIFAEVKRRPFTIVRQIYSAPGDEREAKR